jgi:hypothetical protein
MTDRLVGVRLKLERAEFQRNALENEVKTWVEHQQSHAAFEHERDTGWHRIVVRSEAPDPPLMWGVIVGEIIHNLRSALDHTIWQLVLADKGIPDRNNQFPIFSRPPKKASDFAKCVRGVSHAAETVIRGLQPYTRPKRSELEPVEILSALSNVDKHQTLHPAAVVVSRINAGDVSFAPRGPHRVAEIRWDHSLGQPIRDAELWALRIEPPETEVDMEVKLKIPVGIAFGDCHPVETGKLRNLVIEVGRIVDLLETAASG